MKKIFFSLLVFGCVVAANAQSDVMTATLMHDGVVSAFSGANAFVQAHDAATDGDVISLSSGSFTSLTITKSVTVYGAGFEKDQATATDVTQLRSDLIIGAADQTVSNVHIEGLYINGGIMLNNSSARVEGLFIGKCFLLKGMTFNNGATAKNMLVQDCVMDAGITANNTSLVENAYFGNCYIKGNLKDFPAGSSILVNHCIVTGVAGPYTWKNSIFTHYWNLYNYGAFDQTTGATVYNCVIRMVFSSASATNNSFVDCYYRVGIRLDQIFSDVTGTDYNYSPSRTFELVNPEWLGDDGTEVGIRGGDGWSKAPAIPVVKSLSLDVEGNELKVTYEAEVR